MASTSGSGASATQYDVFLSFRGPDTRNSFTDCLYHDMVGQEIVAYRDSEDLPVGDRIDSLLTAVGNCKIYIPVLSRGFASSAWCLRELTRAVELKASTGKPEILPIFFDVTPSDVKLRTELYVKDLEKHEGSHSSEIRQQWEAALRKVAEIEGWEVQGKGYVGVIDLVVKDVLRKLEVRQRPLDTDADSGTGVRFVGIHGMDGTDAAPTLSEQKPDPDEGPFVTQKPPQQNMASTSGSGASVTQHDMFLSFRGPNTRDTFTGCLYHYMVGQGMVVYRDGKDLHVGDWIDDLQRNPQLQDLHTGI